VSQAGVALLRALADNIGRRRLKIQAIWPWAADIVTAWERISALPQVP
jgi:hypothetical protein